MTVWARQVQAAITPYAGTLQHLERDRFVVLFGAPYAQEDHAQRALLSAGAVQQRWRDYLHTHMPTNHAPPTLGVGLAGLIERLAPFRLLLITTYRLGLSAILGRGL